MSNKNELIVVKQIPVIIEQLASIKEQVIAKTDEAIKMVCTEENYKDIKKLRAALNQEFKDFEIQRRDVKNAILKPYEQFENVYKDCVSQPYKTADIELKRKIDEVESNLKHDKRNEITAYFKEYSETLGIDFVSFEQVGCNITMSVSCKKLREQVKAFLDKVMDDIKLISTQEHRTDILVEYKKTLNVSLAITTVTERYEAIAAEKARAEAEKAEREIAQANEENNIKEYEPYVANVPQEIETPAEEIEDNEEVSPYTPEPVFPLTFTVYGTKSQLRDFANTMKEIINERGLRYE